MRDIGVIDSTKSPDDSNNINPSLPGVTIAMKPEAANAKKEVYNPLYNPVSGWIPKDLQWLIQAWRSDQYALLLRGFTWDKKGLLRYWLAIPAYVAIVLYAVLASGVFAILAFLGAKEDPKYAHLSEIARAVLGAALYGSSSLAANIPMSFLYAINMLAIAEKIMKIGKWLGVPVLSISLAAAIATTISGIQLAADAVNKIFSFPFFRWTFTSAFLFNTFSTRFGGTISLVLSLIGAVIFIKNNYVAAMANLKTFFGCELNYAEKLYFIKGDVDLLIRPELDKKVTFGKTEQNESIQLDLKQMIEDAAEKKESGKTLPGTSTMSICGSWIQWLLTKTGLFALPYLSWVTFPIFMAKAYQGMSDSGGIPLLSFMTSLASNSFAVAFFALSNQLFYMQASMRFVETCFKFMRYAYMANCDYDMSKVGEGSQRRIYLKTFLVFLFVFVPFAALCWFSGGGYSREMWDEILTWFSDAPPVLDFLDNGCHYFPPLCPVINLIKHTMREGTAQYLVQLFSGGIVNFNAVLVTLITQILSNFITTKDKFAEKVIDSEFGVVYEEKQGQKQDVPKQDIQKQDIQEQPQPAQPQVEETSVLIEDDMKGGDVIQMQTTKNFKNASQNTAQTDTEMRMGEENYIFSTHTLKFKEHDISSLYASHKKLYKDPFTAKKVSSYVGSFFCGLANKAPWGSANEAKPLLPGPSPAPVN